MTQRKLLIFDLDGTVVDSMPFLRELGIAIMASVPHVFEAEATAHYDATVGRPFHDQLNMLNERLITMNQQLFSVDRRAELYTRVHRVMAPLFPLTSLGLAIGRPMRDPTWRFALVSSTHRDIVRAMPQLRECQFHAMGGYDGANNRKEAQCRGIIDAWRIPLEDCYYIGDTESDRALAEMLGVHFYPHTIEFDDMLNEINGVPPYVP
jgi:phosphoglycolate phosphatase-like HAD superfamily hydrolase